MKVRYAKEVSVKAVTETIHSNQNFTFAKFPNWLMRRKELSPGAKIVYCRLLQYAGTKSYARVKQETLSLETGFSERQVRRYLVELAHFQLIETEQVGLNSANVYHLLQHIWMEEINQPKKLLIQEQPDLSTPKPKKPLVATPERPDLAGIKPDVADPKQRTDQAIPTILNRSEEKTHLKDHTLKERKPRVCVPSSNRSKFNFEQCKRYAKTQKSIKNPDGWATMAIQTGMYDKEIEAYEIYLAQEEQKVKEAEDNAKKHREDFIAYMLLRAAENPLRNDEIGWLRHVGYTGDLVSL